MNIYDYINSPHRAVKAGYKPCYLTKVSAVVDRAYSIKLWKKDLPKLSVDHSVREFFSSLILISMMVILCISIPLSCWIIALFMPDEPRVAKNEKS